MLSIIENFPTSPQNHLFNLKNTMQTLTTMKNTNIAPEDVCIFAYLRKSTDKEEQKDSITQQEEGVERIAKELGLDMSKITNFTETKSGFENRKRVEWGKMLEEIDKQKQPCILIARDTSRLSRNPTDNLAIANRLFGDNHTKKTLWKIYFLGDGAVIQEWNQMSDKKYIVDKLHQNYIESIETKTKSINGHILKLDSWIYPYTPPKGLGHIVHQGKRILKQNEKMPFVRKAFEMKAEGRNHKKISKYLLEFWGIKLSDRELSDRLFSNLVYIWEYVEKNTNLEFKNLLFFEGNPPIARSLWDKVQLNKGKKKDNYWEKQGNFALGSILRTESGKKLSGYLKKGTNQYKNTIEGIHVSEKWILQEYLKYMKQAVFARCIDLYIETSLKNGQMDDREVSHWRESWIDFLMGSNNPDSMFSDFNSNPDTVISIGPYPDDLELDWEVVSEITSIPPNTTIEFMANTLENLSENYSSIIKKFQELFAEYIDCVSTLFDANNSEMREMQKSKLKNLELEKKNIEIENTHVLENFLRMRVIIEGADSVVKETIKNGQNRILAIHQEMESLQNEDEFEIFCKRLPVLLKKTFELSEKALFQEEYNEIQQDLYDLINATTFELKIGKKKALEIGLYWPAWQVLFWKDAVLEAPAGVEPASRALQAPVWPFYQGAK